MSVVVYSLKESKHSVSLKSILLLLILMFGISSTASGAGVSKKNASENTLNERQANKSVSTIIRQGGLLIKDVQVRSVDANTTDVKLIFANEVTPRYFILKDPTRLVVDIPQGQLKNAIRSEVFTGTLIKTVRHGKQPNQVLRLVFEMNGDVTVSQSVVNAKTIIFHLKTKNSQAIKEQPSPAIAKTKNILPMLVRKPKKETLCSAGTIVMDDMQVRNVDANATEVKLIFSNNPKVHYFTLGNPMRFIVDVENGCLKKTIDSNLFAGTLIKGLRQGKQLNGVLRLAFDMKGDLDVIQSVIDPKVVVFELKNKSTQTITATPLPVVAKTDKPLSVIASKANETPPALPNTPDTGKGISTSVQQDSLLSVVGQIKSFFSFNDKQAVAVELDGGPRILRGNGTYAYALNDNNRVKLTAEYLREDLDFEFYTGDTRQWVQQGAVGAAYEYLLGDGIFKNINVGSHYSHAQSKDLSTQTVVYADGSTLTDFRRIAGGNDLNGNVEAGMQLWKDGVVTAGPDYDRVRYDTQYEYQNGHNAQGFGGHVRLDQKLKGNVGLQLYTTVSQLFDTYGAGLNWSWSSKDNTVWSAGLASSYTQDFTTERNFWVNGLNVSIEWDVPQTKSVALNQNSGSGVVESLTQWVQTPAVRMPDVLAISDERITQTGAIKPFVPITGTCPLGTDVQFSNGNYSANGGWYQSYPSGVAAEAFLVSPDSASIIGNPSGQAACLYGLTGGPPFFLPLGQLVLENNTYQNAVGIGANWIPGHSQFWPQPPYPSSFCNTLAGSACAFSTVA